MEPQREQRRDRELPPAKADGETGREGEGEPSKSTSAFSSLFAPSPPPPLAPSSKKDRILDLRTTGTSYRRIADQLNADEVPGFDGGRWHEKQVRRAVADHQARVERQQTLAV